MQIQEDLAESPTAHAPDQLAVSARQPRAAPRLSDSGGTYTRDTLRIGRAIGATLAEVDELAAGTLLHHLMVLEVQELRRGPTPRAIL